MSHILETKNLTVMYGKNLALNNLSLKLDRGKIIGLLGPNGSGKTTLIKSIMNLIPVHSGEILINGKHPSEKTKLITSYLPDVVFLNENLKVSSTLKVYKDYFNNFNYNKASKMIDDFNIDRGKKIKELSKGTKEKLQVCLIMSREADLYLLDEPLSAVDPATRQYILDTIITDYSPESTILTSTHLIHDIERILDETIFLKDGELLFHKETDIIREEHNMSIEDYFKEVFKC